MLKKNIKERNDLYSKGYQKHMVLYQLTIFMYLNNQSESIHVSKSANSGKKRKVHFFIF